MMDGELLAALFTTPFLAIHFCCSRREKDFEKESGSQELGSYTTYNFAHDGLSQDEAKGSSFDYAWLDSEFQAGDEVYLISFHSNMNLNGQDAVVVEDADKSGRCLVRLNSSGEQVRVFEKKLAHIENKRSELRKEMRMKNQQTGNGFGGARVPSIRSTPRYGSQLTPRSSALEQMQVESDLEGESEKNTTGEDPSKALVVAYVELRQNRKVPPSHAVIGSRARAWSAPAQIPGPSSRKAAIMEMQRECLVDTEKYGEESVEATFPEKVQTNEKMKNVSGAIPPTLWGSPNEGEDSYSEDS